MELDNTTKIFEERYFFEHERHEKLNARLGIPITVLTVIFGIITYFVRNILPIKTGLFHIIFYSLFLLVIASVVLTIFHLIKSYYNYEYAFLPLPSDLRSDINNISDYYENPYFEDWTPDMTKIKINEDINELFLKYYSDCSQKNTENNDKKSKHLHLASSMIIVTIIALFLTSIPFLIIKNNLVEDVQKVKITNVKEFEGIMAKKKNDRPKDPPPKPKPSGARHIKEFDDKPKKKK